MYALKMFDRALATAMKVFCISCLIALTIVLSGVVIIRFVDPSAIISDEAVLRALKLSWSDEVIEWLSTSMIFIGAAALWRDKDHFKVDLLAEYAGDTVFGKALGLVLEIMSALFIACFLYYSFDLTAKVGRTSPYLSLPMTYWYAPMPVSGAIMLAYSIRNIVGEWQKLFGAAVGRNAQASPT